jgi:NAD(P)H-quinone oxidoreductase subunit 5
MTDTLTLLPALPLWQTLLTAAPAAVLALAALAAPGSGPGRTAAPAQPDAAAGDDAPGAWRLARLASGAALALAAAGLAALAVSGGAANGWLRADLLGGVVALLVAFIGWVIVRYSQPYLAGERGAAGQAGYVRWLLATLAAVMAVVAANHLLLLAAAWMVTSLALHRLLTFFRERPAALVAAHKKFLAGRAADLLVLAACGALWAAFGTLRIDALLAQAAALPALPALAQAAVVALALAALLKCAQLPAHGWLIQVMEAPTPVSALLHAGVVNLGGFVLMRLAPLVADTPAAAGLLVVVGTLTAVVAALVMTTRISVKVALAWSTCAQMGFMLMQCGLGLWEMALLHLVAHSLYKAHAFLGAGGVVRQTMVRQLAAPPVPPTTGTLLAGALLGLAMTAAAALAVGALPLPQAVPGLGANPALWVAAGIVALALVPMAAPAGGSGWLRGAAMAFALAALYLALHALLAGRATPADALPAAPWWLFVALAFALLFALQCAVTSRPGGALARRLYPWFYGGLFLDERVSRAVFRLLPPPQPPAPDALAATALPRAA